MDEKNPKGVKFDKAFLGTAILAGIVILVMLAYIVVGWFSDSVPAFGLRAVTDSAMLEQSVRQIGELATLEYSYEAVVVFRDQEEIGLFGLDIAIPGTARSIIFTFEGRMRFGIDMEQISISVVPIGEDEYDTRHEVRVSIPPAGIQTHEIDMDSLNLLDERTGLFVSFDIEDYSHIIGDRMAEVQARPATLELIGQADENARHSIEIFLRTVLDEEYYTIVFL